MPCDCAIEYDGGTIGGKQVSQDLCGLASTEWVNAINQGCGWNIMSR